MYHYMPQDRPFELQPEDNTIYKMLPERGKKEFQENIHRYVEQIGQDYGVVKKPIESAESTKKNG